MHVSCESSIKNIYHGSYSCVESEREGITNLSIYQYILSISSYSDLNVFWDAKIPRTREIMKLLKLCTSHQCERMF